MTSQVVASNRVGGAAGKEDGTDQDVGNVKHREIPYFARAALHRAAIRMEPGARCLDYRARTGTAWVLAPIGIYLKEGSERLKIYKSYKDETAGSVEAGQRGDSGGTFMGDQESPGGHPTLRSARIDGYPALPITQ